jgi:superfamily I DNA and/or RNA helicase
VGITRAKHGLVIVGNAKILKKDKKWNHLLNKKAKNVVEGI